MDPDFRGCQWTQGGTLAYWCEDPDDLISIPASEQNQELWPQVNNGMLSPKASAPKFLQSRGIYIKYCGYYLHMFLENKLNKI